jgi:hypothetical protein
MNPRGYIRDPGGFCRDNRPSRPTKKFGEECLEQTDESDTHICFFKKKETGDTRENEET